MVAATEAITQFPICSFVRCISSRITGISGATANQPKKVSKNADQVMWKARMDAPLKLNKSMRLAGALT